MLKKNFIREVVSLDPEGLDTPDEVLRHAVGLMKQAGWVTQEYIEAVVDAYHQIGPYFVMAPAIAMPHGRPSAAVKQSGVSFVRLKHPVCFGHPENDPVTFVFALAGAENSGHLDMTGALGQFLCRDGILSQLASADSYEAFHALLEQGEVND